MSKIKVLVGGSTPEKKPNNRKIVLPLAIAAAIAVAVPLWHIWKREPPAAVSTQSTEIMTPAAAQETSPTTAQPNLSTKASQLNIGMTYGQVVALLGRSPDTVVNDQIRADLGESVRGTELISFEWQNDNPDCQPVSVDFDPLAMTATGWNEGRTCTGSSIFNEPFGKPCSETTLCRGR